MSTTGEPALAGVAWPAISGRAPRERLLSLLSQFDRTERLPARQLLQSQLLQLGRIIEHARRTVPYYRGRLAACGIRDAVALTAEQFGDLPLLTRRDIQDAGAELRSAAVPPQFGAVYENRTSGATGQPVAVLRTALDTLLWQANTLRDHRWHGRDLSLKLAAIRALAPGVADPPDGVAAAHWGSASAAVGAGGRAALLTLGVDVAVQAQWLRREAPGYLLTYPNNLRALLEHFAACGERLPGLRAVLTVGESVPPALRESCREVLGVGIEDVYSSQELGYVALQCPVSGQYHVMAESVLVEVLDAEGRPCSPGETGRLVVSSLHNHATPLIRYELGDLAEAGASCACGRTLPTLARIAGRSRNMLRLPGGGSHWPLVGFHRFRDIAPVRRYQLIQRDLERIEAHFACDRALRADEERQLAEVIRLALGHPFVVDVRCHAGDLPRPANGKFEEFVCAIPQ